MAYCTVQYRQLKMDGMPEGANLKAMVVAAMRTNRAAGRIGDSAKARIIDLDQDGSYVILNKISEPDTWENQLFAGQLIHLQSGADVAAVMQSLEEDAEEFLVEQVNLGDARVAKGILYFASIDNHLGLIEGQQVKGRTLERYLTALLQGVGTLEVGTPIILNGSFRAGDGKELTEASEITIQAERNEGPAAAAATAVVDEVMEREAARMRRDGATVFDVLRTLNWNEDAIATLQAEIPDDGWIEGFFKVFIKQRNRRKKSIGRAAINEALRNIDPSDIGLDGNGRERGGIVKLSTRQRVQMVGSLLDPADAIEQIVNALKEWAAAGKIDCTFDP
nr:hypothetical protein [Brevundimonas diminuta]